MPTYEYACASCGNRYEKREGFDARPRQKCPKCGKMAQRLLSTPAVVFKGSGFYKTDSRGKSDDSGSSDTPATPAASPTAADVAGQSHGPGGHTHETPASPATKVVESTSKPASKTGPSTETAAAS